MGCQRVDQVQRLKRVAESHGFSWTIDRTFLNLDYWEHCATAEIKSPSYRIKVSCLDNEQEAAQDVADQIENEHLTEVIAEGKP